jgi:hypothetical protein
MNSKKKLLLRALCSSQKELVIAMMGQKKMTPTQSKAFIKAHSSKRLCAW